jgi:hypothetical protein
VQLLLAATAVVMTGTHLSHGAKITVINTGIQMKMMEVKAVEYHTAAFLKLFSSGDHFY